MNIYDYLNASEVAAYIQALPSNALPYLGPSLFPNAQQAGTDISWLKGANNLPVTIQPSNYDAKASIRERAGFSKQATEMAFFRESMRLGEKDRQQLQLLLAQSQGMAQPIITQLYNDTKNLVDGVEAQAEYMRMQLLQYGKFTVKSTNSEAQYTYDYNMDAKQQYTAAKKWTERTTSDPIADILAAMDDMENRTGVRPTRMIMNRNTYNNMTKSDSIKKALAIGVQGSWENFMLLAADAEKFIAEKTQLQIAVYSKKIAQFADADKLPDSGNIRQFNLIDDHVVVLLPPDPVGHTWYGTTPEAFDLASGGTDAQVQVLSGGPTVTTYMEKHPVNVVTVVSAVMIPSFEGIDYVGVIKTNEG
nr:MAG TPA: capsid protein [Caudoviricetes sp.]